MSEAHPGRGPRVARPVDAPRAAERRLFDLVVGARPNFVKMAPVLEALREMGDVEARVVHTGQHYDDEMSAAFFRDLELPPPDVNLEVGSGPHGAQTARMIEGYERVILERRPAVTVVFGDVNSTLAGALAASKQGVPVAHVESGLRSFDRSMPEEVNRVVVDHLADLCLAPDEDAARNLRREGIADDRIRVVGNPALDTLSKHLDRARARHRPEALGLEPGTYVLATFHRPSNVDDPVRVAELASLLEDLTKEWTVVLAAHPRARPLVEALEASPPETRARIHLLGPQGYLDFLSLLDAARAVVTDSGGLQPESAYLGVPCLVARPTTEWTTLLGTGAVRLVTAHASRDTLQDQTRQSASLGSRGASIHAPRYAGGSIANQVACLRAAPGHR